MTYQRIVFTGEEDKVDPGWSVLFNNFQYDFAETTTLLGMIYITVIFAVVLKQQKALYRLTNFVPESGWLMIIAMILSMLYSAYCFAKNIDEVRKHVIMNSALSDLNCCFRHR